MNSKTNNSNKPKLEFAQKVTFGTCIYSAIVVVAVLAANFILLWFSKQPMQQETITTVSIFGGVLSTMTFGGYCALTAIRNCSLNKLEASKSNINEKRDM